VKNLDLRRAENLLPAGPLSAAEPDDMRKPLLQHTKYRITSRRRSQGCIIRCGSQKARPEKLRASSGLADICNCL